MTSADTEYYRRRERQERLTAAGCDDDLTRRLHLELADRYSQLIDGETVDAEEGSARQAGAG